MWYTGEIIVLTGLDQSVVPLDLSAYEAPGIRAFLVSGHRPSGECEVIRVWLGETFTSSADAYAAALHYARKGGYFAPCYI